MEAPRDRERSSNDRSADDRGDGGPVGPGRDIARAVSPGRFRHLVRDAEAALAAADVSAENGSNGLAHRGGGIMWIALSSPWGRGRLVRNADGSCDLEAMRMLGEVLVLDEHHAHVEVEDLQRIVDAIAQPRALHVPA